MSTLLEKILFELMPRTPSHLVPPGQHSKETMRTISMAMHGERPRRDLIAALADVAHAVSFYKDITKEMFINNPRIVRMVSDAKAAGADIDLEDVQKMFIHAFVGFKTAEDNHDWREMEDRFNTQNRTNLDIDSAPR